MAFIQFLGATHTVTGSKFLISHRGKKLLIDCGLFQGPKELRLRNWEGLPLAELDVDAIVLTHAHLDHSGYLPLMVKRGFSGPIFCTPATSELAAIVLPDSAHLAEEEAHYANKEGFSKHSPALPLFNQADAQGAIKLLRQLGFNERREVLPGIEVRYVPAGHILGSAAVEVRLNGSAGSATLLFSGDLGRYKQPLHPPPSTPPQADYVICESTYGDREHSPSDLGDDLARVVNESIARGGPLLMPAFAVDRTQLVLFILRRLEREGRIPTLGVHIDSPMAINVTDVYKRYPEEHSDEIRRLLDSGEQVLSPSLLRIHRSRAESMALNNISGPAVIISASGMMVGGRILHHMKLRLPDPKTTVLITGFQAQGTRGRSLVDGEKLIKIHGELVPVRAGVEVIEGFSAHADYHDMLAWLQLLPSPPKQVFLVHGEENALTGLSAHLVAAGFNKPSVPCYNQTYEIELNGVASR